MSIFGEAYDRLAKANSREYMKEVHKARQKKKGQGTEKSQSQKGMPVAEYRKYKEQYAYDKLSECSIIMEIWNRPSPPGINISSKH